jgi:hypothetical protein
MRRDPSMQELHHSDIITYALTRLAGQYAREKQEILRELRSYRAIEPSDSPVLAAKDPPSDPALHLPVSTGVKASRE